MTRLLHSFADWQKKHRIEMPQVGDEELENKVNGSSTLLGRHRMRKFRHNKIQEAKPLDPKSIDYDRKLKKQKAKLKKQQESGGGGVAPAAAKRSSSARSELKRPEQIRKERRLKEKRRQKTGRPSKKKRVK